MPRRVLVQRDGQSFDLVEVPAPNEHHLQEILKAQPQLIPADDLGFDGDLLVGPDLLEQEDVGGGGGEPLPHALAGGGSDAVDVDGGDGETHAGQSNSVQ